MHLRHRPVAAFIGLYFAPLPFTDALAFSCSPATRTVSTSFTTRQRYMIRSAAGRYLQIGTSSALTASRLWTNRQLLAHAMGA